MDSINARKQQHIETCLKRDVGFDSITTGFENYRFVHNALPEADFDEIDISTIFLGKKLSAPVIISSMTGGTELGRKINENLALVAQKHNIALAIGSQRAALQNSGLQDTFTVRGLAPKIPILANIGAVQLNYGVGIEECKKIVKMVNADALILHLNPLQEALQGGDTNFKDLLHKIRILVEELNVPIIVKEVGFGISLDVAKRLEKIGIKIIDVAGAGGTNFAKVESIINKNKTGKAFYDWGIPTSNLIKGICRNTRLSVIAGGGIRSGVDIAKAICLGADLASIALPFLKPATISAESVEERLNQFIKELRIAMFCVGAVNINELRRAKLVRVR